MSSPDNTSPWGTPQTPSGSAGPPEQPYPAQQFQQAQPSSPQDFGRPAQSPTTEYELPAPPPMMSPYGMPLAGGGPEGPGGPGGHGPGGYGGPGDPADSRRRKTLIASALAVVAVVGIGGAAMAFTGGDSPKHDTTSLAGAGSSESGANAGHGAAVAGGGGKPDGDAMVGASTNGAQGADVPGSSTGGNGGNGTTSASGGTTGTPNQPGGPTSAPGGAPASSAASTPKPSTSTTAKPSSDCTYLDLPATSMPVIKDGSTSTNAVKELQCLLKKSELNIKTLAIDGQWGPDTQSAMNLFLTCNNSPSPIPPGGHPPYTKLTTATVAGPETWADLYFWDHQRYNGIWYYCNGTRDYG